MKRYGYEPETGYDYDVEYAAEFLSEQLGREPTDYEIEEFIEIQETRAMDVYENMIESLSNETRE